NWDDSRFIEGYPGKHAIMARKKGDTWFIVGINGDNEPKVFDIDLSFVNQKDGFIISEDANGFQQNPINATDKLTVTMKAHDGFVMKF
ncbi:MAG TPA: glycoside hydrolase family 97 C-terminal domain-containing protein, partial [Mariniflexile sp.]